MTELDLKSDFSSRTPQDWRSLVESALRGAPYGSPLRETEDGISRGCLLSTGELPETSVHLNRSELQRLSDRDWQIAASSLLTWYSSLASALQNALKAKAREGIFNTVGGAISPEDVETSKDMNAQAGFLPSTNIPDAVLEVLDVVNMRLSQGA